MEEHITTFEDLAKKLFETALAIVEYPRKRSNIFGIRNALMVITNDLWNDSWAVDGEPEWYTRATALRDQIQCIFDMHVMSVEDVPGFTTNDLRNLDPNPPREHLQEWFDAWITVIKPQIEDLRRQTLGQ